MSAKSPAPSVRALQTAAIDADPAEFAEELPKLQSALESLSDPLPDDMQSAVDLLAKAIVEVHQDCERLAQKLDHVISAHGLH